MFMLVKSVLLIYNALVLIMLEYAATVYVNVDWDIYREMDFAIKVISGRKLQNINYALLLLGKNNLKNTQVTKSASY